MKPFMFFMMAFLSCQLWIETPRSIVISLDRGWGETPDPILQESDLVEELAPLHLNLERSIHFIDVDENDLLVEPGNYEVEAGEEEQIWLIATQSREAFHLKALSGTHEEIVDEPQLLSTSNQEGRFDIVLLLPDGNSLNAVGSYSGIQSRGMFFKPLSQSAVGIARQQTSPPIVQTPIPTPPAPPPPSDPAAPVPPPASSDPQEAIQVSSRIGNPRLITWTYIQMNRPETVALLLRDVQTGKLPAAALQGLASPAELSTMLKKDWNAEVLKSQAARAASAAQTSGIRTRDTGPRVGVQSGTKYLKSGMIVAAKPKPFVDKPVSESSPIYRMPVYPESWDMKSHYIGQTHRRLFTFNAPVAGEVRVILPKNSKLKVRSLESYTGTLPPPREGMGKFLETTRLSARLWPDVEAKRTAAPWVIPVRNKQGVAITMEFSPSALDGIPMGPFRDSFTVELARGSANVPVQAHIEGILFGIDAQFPEASWTLPGKDFLIPVQLHNKGETSEATIEVVEAPPGITVDPVKITLARQEQKSVSLVAHVNMAASPVKDGIVRFRFVNGNQRWYWDMGLTVYYPWIQTYVDMKACFSDSDCLAVSNGLAEFRSDGWWHWKGRVDGCKINPFENTTWEATLQFVGGGERKSGTGDCRSGERNRSYDVSGLELGVHQGFYSLAKKGRNAFLAYLKGKRAPGL